FGAHSLLTPDELSVLISRSNVALRSAKQLQGEVESWREGTQFRTEVKVHEPERTSFDLFVETSRTYPHEIWAFKASEVLHHARATLDNLNDRLFAKFAGPHDDSSRTAFPITRSGKDWRAWKQ